MFLHKQLDITDPIRGIDEAGERVYHRLVRESKMNIPVYVRALVGLSAIAAWIAMANTGCEGAPRSSKSHGSIREGNAPPKSAYVRPATAPNGQPWPATAAYIEGYPRLRMNGHSSVTIDNSRNDSDVFVKLVSLETPRAYAVRTCFIPAHDKFTLENLTAGRYDVRYRDLGNGTLWRSEAFELEERTEQHGIVFSKVTLTLYKVPDGNTRTYPLSEAEF